ncbi:MAG: acyltransferase [Actinobacteria bacterium]|nr:acyltransferase [Actinomycetota bacterium]
MSEATAQTDGGASGIAGPGTTVEHERGTRFPCFDGFRAIAALGVLVNHTAFFSGKTVRSDTFGPFLSRLDIGVAIFFLISGFLLYRPFVTRIFAGASAPAIGPYLKRRALRILPAYWVCLTVVIFVLGQHDVDVKGFFLHYGLLQIYSHDHIIGGPVQQAWTLSVEVTFYLFLPVFAWVMTRFTRDARNALRVQLIGAGALYAISCLYRGLLYLSDVQDTGRYRTWLPGYFDYFALGIALAALSAWLAQPGRREWRFLSSRWFPWVSWLLAFAMFWIVSKAIGLPRGPTETVERDLTGPKEFGLQLFYGLGSFFLLLPGIFGPQGKGLIRKLLTNPAIVWLGLVSYGIYLWHESAIELYADWTDSVQFAANFSGALVVVLVLSLVAAAVSYYVVERPALALKDRTLWRR